MAWSERKYDFSLPGKDCCPVGAFDGHLEPAWLARCKTPHNERNSKPLMLVLEFPGAASSRWNEQSRRKALRKKALSSTVKVMHSELLVSTEGHLYPRPGCLQTQDIPTVHHNLRLLSQTQSSLTIFLRSWDIFLCVSCFYWLWPCVHVRAQTFLSVRME